MKYRNRRQHTRRRALTTRLLQSLLGLYPLLRIPVPIDELLQALLDTAIECIPGAQRGSLMVREGSDLRFRATNGYDLELLRPVRFPAAPLITMLPSGQRSAQVESYREWDEQHLDDETNRILQQHGRLDEIRRSLMTSIIVSETFYGTLVVDNLLSHSPFPPEAESLATLFAEQAGALIEHAQVLDQLRMTSARLAEAEKLASIGRLVAGVAHEINNPLTAVLGYTELLAAEELGEEARAALEQIQAGASRVSQIVHNLQIFARQQRGGTRATQINQLIEQTLALKQAEFALEQIEVHKQLVELPTTWGDAGQISQVLLNLLINAQHALRERPASRRLTIRTSVERAGHTDPELILIAIADNGRGIAPEVLPRIFEPFFTTKPAGHGTGLGLSVCHGIIADHGGRIWAESQPGQGAMFSIELPVRAPAMEQAGPDSLPHSPPVAPPEGRRILLVEDDASVIYLVTSALGRKNLLTTAAEGVQALDLVRAQSFDLVLCDLRMPGMSGQDFYSVLERTTPALARRLLFISGDTSSAATRDFLRRSGRPLLSKPFTPNDLYGAIAALDASP